jgi:Helix-turn-helix domain
MSEGAMADTFTRDQFIWLRQVAADASLPPLAARIAIVLTEYFNKKTGTAWPSQATLSKHLGVSDRTIRQNIAAMAKLGHLGVEVRRGRYRQDEYQSNVYRMILQNRNESSGLSEAKPEEGFLFTDDLNRKFDAPKPEESRQVNRKQTSYEHLEEEHSEEHFEGPTKPKVRDSTPKARRRRQQTTWPEGFHLDDHLADHAAKKAGWDHGRAFAEFERFENFHRSKGTVFADWRAAWRTWVSNGVRFDRERAGKQGPVIDQAGNPATPPPYPQQRPSWRRPSNMQRAMMGAGND